MPLTESRTRLTETIDFVHQNIHEGIFFVSFMVGTLGNGASADMLLTTGTRSCHFAFNASVQVNCQIQLLLEPTVTVSGAALSNLNANANSSIVATMQPYSGPTYSAIGTVWSQAFIPGGSGGNASGGSSNSRIEEHILKPNTDYGIRITNLTATNNAQYSIDVGWYEPQ